MTFIETGSLKFFAFLSQAFKVNLRLDTFNVVDPEVRDLGHFNLSVHSSFFLFLKI